MNKIIDAKSKVFPWFLHPVQLYVLGQDLGISAQRLLQSANLTDADLTELSLRLSWQQYRSMLEQVSQSGKADWAFQFGKQLTLPSHGLFSLAVTHCDTIAQALKILVKFKPLVTSAFQLIYRESNEHIIIELQPEFNRDPILPKLAEVFFTMVYQSLRQISPPQPDATAGKPDLACSVDIAIAAPCPSYYSSINTFMEGNLTFQAAVHQLRIHKDAASQPLQHANPLTFSSIECDRQPVKSPTRL